RLPAADVRVCREAYPPRARSSRLAAMICLDRFLCLSTVVFLAACSGEIEVHDAAGTASAAAGSGGAAGAGSGGAGAGGAGSAGGVAAGGAGGSAIAIEGHFMKPSIGNCINAEDWLSFSAPPGFVHTLVDRNFCGPHGV